MSIQALEFEAQTTIFNALTSSSAFMTAVSNKIFDTPQDNQAEPYVCLENINSTPHNRHGKLGRNVYYTFGIYTQPYGLGTYEANNIHGIMDDVLDMKRLTMETSNFENHITKFFDSDTFKNKDRQGRLVTYHTILWNKNDY